MSELMKRLPTDVVEVIILYHGRNQRYIARHQQVRPLMQYLEKNDFASIKASHKTIKKSIAWEKLAEDQIKTLPRGAIALRGSRVKENMTQLQLARLVKIEQTNISKMERGKRTIGKVMAHRLAKVLHVDYRLFL